MASHTAGRHRETNPHNIAPVMNETFSERSYSAGILDRGQNTGAVILQPPLPNVGAADKYWKENVICNFSRKLDT